VEELLAPQTLDPQHQQGLNQVVRDLSDLHSRLQTSSYRDIESHPRITITGDWNQTCLVNLMTLIQNQGMNRKMFNDGALTTVDKMLDLVDPFLLPFSTLKRFLTSEVIEELILNALQSNDPEGTLQAALEEKAQENGANWPEGKEGERLIKQMEQLMEMYALARENGRLPDDAKWYHWDFDPGRSTLDDFIPDLISAPDRVIPSQAMVRFGTVDPDDSPVEDNTNGRGLTVQRIVMKGVAEAPYPASSNCVGQIKDYEITINNYGHIENGRFVSDYIEYEIDLNCCEGEEEEEEGDISYPEPPSEPIAYFPGDDYALFAGAIAGFGWVEEETKYCFGLNAQFYPGMSIGACGAQPGIGLQLAYDYAGFGEDSVYRFTDQGFQLRPQLLLQSPILPNVHLISGLSVPVGFGQQKSEGFGEASVRNRRSFGLSLTTGLTVELPKWQFQVQTDLAGWQRQTFFDPDFPEERSQDSDFWLLANKGNLLTFIAGLRL
jgi:hypothetical protein